MANFSDLNEDIILAILLCCNVFTILKMEQTCRYLRNVTLSRLLWLTMVQELDYDHAPNLLPYESLHSLRTERLREMMIRSTRVHLNWTSFDGPKATRTTSFEIRQKHAVCKMLLPGGKYFAFLDDECFHCYDTETQLKICSYSGAASLDEKMHCMDCLLLDDRDTLVFAYGTFRESDRRSAVDVVRLDIHSGATSITHSFVLPDDPVNKAFHISRITIGTEVVVVEKFGGLFVENWRTGEVIRIMIDHDAYIHSFSIIKNHLCAIQKMHSQDFSFSAAPLSLLFPERDENEGRERSEPALSKPIQFQDVFRNSTKILYPETNIGMLGASLKKVSICSNSWKTPGQCELDAPVISTRLLFYFRISSPVDDHIVSELLLFPTSNIPSNKSSTSSLESDTQEIGYFTTRQRQSPAYSHRGRYALLSKQIAGVTRTGHAITTYRRTSRASSEMIPEIYNRKRGAYATNMSDLLEERLSYEPIEPTGDERTVRRVEHPSLLGGVLGIAVDNGHKLSVESYSSAIWYLSDSTLFIHHTD